MLRINFDLQDHRLRKGSKCSDFELTQYSPLLNWYHTYKSRGPAWYNMEAAKNG
jgi:hypothetical protein